MEAYFAALEQAFSDYRQDLDNYQRTHRPTEGLLGFGRSIKDDPCHERLDERVGKSVGEMCGLAPSPEDAERAVRLLLFRPDFETWPLSAQWMLRAVERHSLPLIQYLSPESAAAIYREYGDRYRRWERLPVQKTILKALKSRT